jgi:hypothetical protein
MISIESGTKIWDAISDRPVDDLNLKPETKALLKDSLFVHPLPFVETVIFIATPHGGSYQASMTVVGLFMKLVTLPVTVATAAADMLANAGEALKLGKERRYFSSVAGMSPGNPVIGALRAIPVAPGIHAHSIIPTLQDGPLDTRNDGVVEYKSAHIDGVESEMVIEHSSHSTQSNPLTVREVRRILIEELGRPGRASGRDAADAPASNEVRSEATGASHRHSDSGETATSRGLPERHTARLPDWPAAPRPLVGWRGDAAVAMTGRIGREAIP